MDLSRVCTFINIHTVYCEVAKERSKRKGTLSRLLVEQKGEARKRTSQRGGWIDREDREEKRTRGKEERRGWRSEGLANKKQRNWSPFVHGPTLCFASRDHTFRFFPSLRLLKKKRKKKIQIFLTPIYMRFVHLMTNYSPFRSLLRSIIINIARIGKVIFWVHERSLKTVYQIVHELIFSTHN